MEERKENMHCLNVFFRNLHDSREQILSGCTDGKQFELKIADQLVLAGFRRVDDDQDFRSGLSLIKSDILEGKIPENTFPEKYRMTFMYQPFGTQCHPDFLIFTEKRIYSLEAKSSNANIPMWNGGIPLKNCFYVFGQRKRKDITFFRGKDILSDSERNLLDRTNAMFAEMIKEFQKREEFAELSGRFEYYPRYTVIQKYSILDNDDRDAIEYLLMNKSYLE